MSAFYQDVLAAILHGNNEGVKLLLESDDVLLSEEEQYILLLKACERGQLEMAKMLLEYGAVPNVNILIITAENGRTELVRLLLDYGVDIHGKDDEALVQACKNGHLQTAQLLFERGANMHAQEVDESLLVAVSFSEQGTPDMIRLLLEKDPHVPQQDLDRALMSASKVDIAELLIANGSNIVNARQHGLSNAAANGSIPMVNFFLDHGADVNEGSPLVDAVYHGYRDIADLLLRRGADIHANDNEALHFAHEQGHEEVVQLLIDRGAFEAIVRMPTSVLSSDSAYHGFFLTFCEHSGRINNRIHLERFRQIMSDAATILQLSSADLQLIQSGTQRQLCAWMQQKQNERCLVCQSQQQYNTEPFTQEPVNTIPLLFLWIQEYEHQTSQCYDLIQLALYIRSKVRLGRNPTDQTITVEGGVATNPFNRQEFTNQEVIAIIERANVVERIMKNVFEMIPLAPQE